MKTLKSLVIFVIIFCITQNTFAQNSGVVITDSTLNQMQLNDSLLFESPTDTSLNQTNNGQVKKEIEKKRKTGVIIVTSFIAFAGAQVVVFFLLKGALKAINKELSNAFKRNQ